jgi:hypothetical protein
VNEELFIEVLISMRIDLKEIVAGCRSVMETPDYVLPDGAKCAFGRSMLALTRSIEREIDFIEKAYSTHALSAKNPV